MQIAAQCLSVTAGSSSGRSDAPRPLNACYLLTSMLWWYGLVLAGSLKCENLYDCELYCCAVLLCTL